MTIGNRRTSQAEHSVSGTITLGDLRWLIQQCVKMPDNSSVDVKEGKTYNAREWDEDSITVKGDLP